MSAAEPIRRRVLIRGRVQGVGFRWSCRRMAEAEGVAGWCRNLPDGRVEACFEGESAAVERALDWCRAGPTSAIVTSVDVTPETPRGERDFDLDKFIVRTLSSPWGSAPGRVGTVRLDRRCS